MKLLKGLSIAGLYLGLGAVCAGPALAAEDAVTVRFVPGGMELRPNVEFVRLVATLAGPEGIWQRKEFDGRAAFYVPFKDQLGERLGDATYSYEVRVVPRLDPELAEAMKRAREEGNYLEEERLRRLAPKGAVQSGYFTLRDGVAIPDDEDERSAGSGGKASAFGGEAPQPDQTIAQSLCVGFDCPGSPTFSDTTILTRENNLRIKFDDTSTLSGFPNRDWSLNANDSASGGQNRFWIQDCGNSSQGGCSGNGVFTVEAGVRNNALYVDSSGRIGFGTSTPVEELHLKTGDSPGLRLEQDGSSGFAAQSWDISGNEANFFVRDVTGGSKLPFRIRPGAPTSSIDIASSGNVGIGTASPSAALHVRRTDGTAKILAEDTASSGDKVMLHLNSSASDNKVRFLYQAGTKIWSLDNNGGQDTFSIAKVGGGNLTIDNAGNVTTTGTVNGVSDRNAKEDIEEVDAQQVLARVAQMPISTWRFKQASEQHMGPMAQDFAAAFGLGADDKHIALNDLGGVALAAIKALNETVNAKDALLSEQQAEIRALKQGNAELAERLAALERAVAAH